MKKLIVAVTNRSSYNKVKTIIKDLPAHVTPVLVLGNSVYFYKYGYAYQNIRNDFPDLRILKTSLAVEGDDLFKMPKTVGLGLIEVATLLDNEKPDMVLTVADRYETLATAVSAAYVNIPLVHLQGGEVSGTIDDKVRNAITQLADYHFPATDEAADRIMRMKPEDHSRIWNMGCPSMDLIRGAVLNIHFFDAINHYGHGDKIDISEPYIIVMLHPDTKGSFVDVEMVMDALNEFQTPKLIFWPNIDPSNDRIAKAWRMSQEGYWKSPVRYVRHVPQELFGHLLVMSDCIIGNSSAGIREATYTGTPSITLGERQKGREHGVNVIRIPFDKQTIINALTKQINTSYVTNEMYGDGKSGKKIAEKLGQVLEG